jgi:TetR/AcrR family transcriptional repressor of nem operon
MARVTDTREKLLEAALLLIWDESLGAASVDAICEKAEVRKGSFYHFFKSKEELVVAALEAHFKVARVDFDRLFSPSVPPVERLKGFFELMVRKQQMKLEKAGRVVGCPYASVGMALSPEDKLVRDCVQDILSTWKKYFETALRDGGRGRLDPGPGHPPKRRDDLQLHRRRHDGRPDPEQHDADPEHGARRVQADRLGVGTLEADRRQALGYFFAYCEFDRPVNSEGGTSHDDEP